MNIFKFGGASVKDADSVRNVLNVLEVTQGGEKLIVVSAMGKMTNALEILVREYLDQKPYQGIMQEIKEFHYEILEGLFPNKAAAVFARIKELFDELQNFLSHNKSNKYDYVYDQIICYGELISTTIVSEFLNLSGIENQWIDARNFIKTDSTYRDAEVNWELTQEAVASGIKNSSLKVTQGFIGSDPNNFTTTLGREGSDYSAAIFAYCLNAESVTIWKDVEGVLNGDPRVFKNTQLLNQVSYEEAIELAFYGASVIHPKTLQPLQRKEIPLFVRSFLNPGNNGTAVSRGKRLIPQVPCFIVKMNQVLISLSTLDFSFMVEENISHIFRLFHEYQIKVNLIQNSAISFSVCVDDKFNTLEKLIIHLKARYKVEYATGVSLYTIRHFDQESINDLSAGKEILLKQVARETIQLVAKN